MIYYMNVGPQYMEPIARQLYQEISLIEQEHVTHYESLLDPGETWWERLVTHEYNECYLYYSFMQQETDPRIKAIWELHLHMELAHLQQAARPAAPLRRPRARADRRQHRTARAGDVRAEQGVPAAPARHPDRPHHARRRLRPRGARAVRVDAGAAPRRRRSRPASRSSTCTATSSATSTASRPRARTRSSRCARRRGPSCLIHGPLTPRGPPARDRRGRPAADPARPHRGAVPARRRRHRRRPSRTPSTTWSGCSPCTRPPRRRSSTRSAATLRRRRRRPHRRPPRRGAPGQGDAHRLFDGRRRRRRLRRRAAAAAQRRPRPTPATRSATSSRSSGRSCPPTDCAALAAAVRAAEALAPTRPHPGTESATANLALGPPLAVVDRARDLIRDTIRTTGPSKSR